MKPARVRDKAFGPQPAHDLDLLRLACPAGLPVDAEGFVLDMVPATAYAQAQPPAAQEIHLGSLLGGDAGLPLRQDEDTAGEPDGPGRRGQEGERRERLMERIGLVIERCPAVSRGGTEDMVGDLDIGVAEILGRLGPIADLRRIATDIAGRKPGIQSHRVLLWWASSPAGCCRGSTCPGRNQSFPSRLARDKPARPGSRP
jgi:hypothetical protein